VPECGVRIAQVYAALGTPTMGRSVIIGTILDDEGQTGLVRRSQLIVHPRTAG
jgi:hypothetical protein